MGHFLKLQILNPGLLVPFHTVMAELSSWNRDSTAHRAKIFTIWSFQENLLTFHLEHIHNFSDVFAASAKFLWSGNPSFSQVKYFLKFQLHLYIFIYSSTMGYTTYKIHPILKLDMMFRINEELHVENKK